MNPSVDAALPAHLPAPLLSVRSLAQLAAISSPASLCILDATADLPRPRFDGDYRLASGAAAWRRRHIPGSRHADLVQDLSIAHPVCSFMHPSPQVLAAALEGLGVADEKTVVIYDSDGGLWAARLWWMLRAIGVQARVLDGGLQAWEAAGYAISSDAPAAPEKKRLSVGERRGLWVGQREVQARLRGEGRASLVCALSAAVFAGAAPTRYARRGHIPGSLNLPARQFFGADGRYLPLPALRDLVEQVLPDDAAPRWLYCGGGISAAVVALVLTMLGQQDLAIYDGSLQEWAADRTLPLVCAADDALPPQAV